MNSKVKTIWIIPRNDLEAVEIINLLQNHGENILVSRQPWGASWEGLESGVHAEVERLLAENPGTKIVGVELAGVPLWGGRNIDHHRYADGDRFSEKSSMEQIAEELGIELNRYYQLVVANDKGWIPALVRAGASLGEIEMIRIADRCAQGVTPDDEAQAVRDIQRARWRGRKVLIHCPKGSTSAHTDRLYGKYDECLTQAPDKWIYYGPRHQELYNLVQFQGIGNPRNWTGGRKENGFAGFLAPCEKAQQVIVNFFGR